MINEPTSGLWAYIDDLRRQNMEVKIERNRYKVALQEIADAAGFDNIGNWARNKARDTLEKEAQP